MAKSFLDTNIFFYAIDSRYPDKQKIARSLISDVVSSGSGMVSSQVIQEFAHNAVQKLGFTPDQTTSLCDGFSDHTVIRADLDLVRTALRLMSVSSISFWDACIVAAAEQGECRVLYTEDLNAGQSLGRVRVVNPFL